MKKAYIIFITGLIIVAIALGYSYYKSKNNKNSNNSQYSGERLSANNELNTANETTQNEKSQETENSQEQNATTEQTESSNSEEQKDEEPSKEEDTNEEKQETETQIAEFTTKIYTKDSDRQNNMNITCSSLNGTTVDNGQTFSFCNTVGKATSTKGYEKADVYKDGKKVQALGGGNCQVSSTLYNAVLKVDGLKVTERHEHSNSVPYVAKGKDAAVAFGSYDFKFINNTGNKIKITASCDKNYVYIKIFKIA